MIDPTQDHAVRIEMLGGFSVSSQGETFTRFRTQRTAALLAYLAYHLKRPHPRDLLAELLWPDSEPPTARLNLRVALNALRGQLESPEAPGSILLADRLTVQLNPDKVTVDVADFEAGLQNAGRSRDVRERIVCLEEACSQYKGPLLPGFHDDWVLRERDRLAWAYLEASGSLCDSLAKAGNLGEAVRYAKICAEEDPFDDAATERLVRLLVKTGRQQDAREYYERFKSLLDQELGLQPSPALAEITANLPARRKTPAAYKVDPDRAPSTARGSIPLYLTRFLARDEELARLTNLLTRTDDRSRLITIVGPGGCGKTRLMVEGARSLREYFSGGIWFVDLSGHDDPRNIPSAISTTLGLRSESGPDRVARIAESLGESEVLLALDNMEQLVNRESSATDEGLQALREILSLAPSLTLVTTSRHTLGIEGEVLLRLEPLTVPEVDSTDLASVPSVALFVDRAQLALPEFALSESNAEPLRELCRRLEGIPLAIELAAAWSHTLSPAQILDNLEHKDAILSSRRRDMPERHRSLRATIAWSFNLLPSRLRQLLEDVSVFRGGCTLEAVSAVSQSPTVVSDLADLQERSHLIATNSLGARRFSILESVREYAEESLESSRRCELSERHAAFFERFAARAQHNLRTDRLAEELARLQAEDENIRAALNWALSCDHQLAARMMRSLSRYWEIMCRDTEACQWFEQLNLSDLESSEIRAETEIAYARFHLREYRTERARQILDPLLPICAAAGRRDLEAAALYLLAHIALNLGERVRASETFDRALSIFAELKMDREGAACLINLGETEIRNGNLTKARDYCERARRVSEQSGDVRGLLVAIGNLAEVALDRGSYAEAKRLYNRELRLCHETGDQYLEAITLHGMGLLAASASEFGTARRLFERSLRLSQRMRSAIMIRLVQCDLADLDRQDGHPKRSENVYSLLLEDDSMDDRVALRALCGLATLALNRGDHESALPLLRESLSRSVHLSYAKEALEVADATARYLAVSGCAADATRLMASIDAARMTTGFVRHPADASMHEEVVRLIAGNRDVLVQDVVTVVSEICSDALACLSVKPFR